MGKRYAILGGGGSFGIHTALYLLGYCGADHVLGIGRNPLRPPAFSLGVNDYANYDYITRHITYEFDLLMDDLDEWQPQVIINFAAQGEGAVSWRHSWRFFETNSMALARFAEHLHERDYFERFIQIGTSEMYGSCSEPADENAKINPTSPYAVSKVAFDMYLQAIHKRFSFPMNIIRPCNAYCPGQLLHRVIPKAIVYGLTGRRIPLEGGGKVEKSYIHARDLARAIWLVSEKDIEGEIYNAGSALSVSIKDVVAMCAESLGMKLEDLATVTPGRLGEDARYWLDSTKIRRDTGWIPEIGWEKGLGEMVLWAKTHIDTLKNWPTTYTLRG